MLLHLDPLLIRKIVLMTNDSALLMTCKEILNATTLCDRVLMAVRENGLRPGTALREAINADVKIEIIRALVGVLQVPALGGCLCIACGNGQLHIVDCLLDAGACVHTLDDQPLMIACRFGHEEIVKRLLAAGADVRARDGEAVKIATNNGHACIVELLHDARDTKRMKFTKRV
jgi:hypothetical protein